MKIRDLKLKTIYSIIVVIGLFTTMYANAADHRETPAISKDPTERSNKFGPVYIAEGDQVIFSAFLPAVQSGRGNASCSDIQYDIKVSIFNIENPDRPLFSDILSLSSIRMPGKMVMFVAPDITASVVAVVERVGQNTDDHSLRDIRCQSVQEVMISLQVMSDNGCSQFIGARKNISIRMLDRTDS